MSIHWNDWCWRVNTFFGHLMPRTDSLENTLILRKIEGGRRRGRHNLHQRGISTQKVLLFSFLLQKITPWCWKTISYYPFMNLVGCFLNVLRLTMESFLHIPYYFPSYMKFLPWFIRIAKKYKSFRICFKCVFQNIMTFNPLSAFKILNNVGWILKYIHFHTLGKSPLMIVTFVISLQTKKKSSFYS